MTCSRVAALLLSLGLSWACSRAQEGAVPRSSPSATTEEADPARPLPSPVPDVVARVNGQPITLVQIVPVAREWLLRVPAAQRDERRPEALRLALERYIERELLLQEALARGVEAETHDVEWAYDQARREHPDELEWAEYLAKRGLDPDSFKAELRIQHTVAALIEDEGKGFPLSDEEVRRAFEADPGSFATPGGKAPTINAVRDRVRQMLRRGKVEETTEALLRRLRARARIETFL